MRIHVAPEIWIRSERWRIGNGSAILGFAAFGLWLGVYLLVLKHWQVDPTTATKIGQASIGFGIAVLSLPLAVRQLRVGLWISRERVVIRGTFKTYVCLPDDVVAFVPGTRLAPCPLLRRTHGRPLAVSALSRSGFLRTSAPLYLHQLAPVCDDLNELLGTVQSAAAAPRGTLNEEANREHAMERYRVLRRVILGLAAIFWIVAGILVALLPRPSVAAFMIVLALLNTLSTYLTLRRARNNVERQTSTPVNPTNADS
jgi:hypothetical protein